MPREIKPYTDCLPFPQPSRQPMTAVADAQPQRAGEELLPLPTWTPVGNPDSATKPRGIMPTGYPTNNRPPIVKP